MRSLMMWGALTASMVLACPAPVMAHGGQYRGPQDVVPPNPGGGRPNPGTPNTPRPGGPVTPGGSGSPIPNPHTGRPGLPTPPGPGARPGTPITPGHLAIGDDLTRWVYWWEFNKDPFINLKSAVHQRGTVTRGSDLWYFGAGPQPLDDGTLRPTRATLMGQVMPALHRALETSTQRDIVSSCLVAMAKIGQDRDEIRVLDECAERLVSSDQEIRETAALAMGISQRVEALDDLAALVRDDRRGRELCDRHEVDDRTRSFAAYGLGLIGYASSSDEVKGKALAALREILEDDSISDRNVRVAAISAIGLLRPDAASEGGLELFGDCLDALEAYAQKKLGVGQQMIQAHVPTAVAKLFADPAACVQPELVERLRSFQASWMSWISSSRGDLNAKLVQSAIIALGRSCEPATEIDGEPVAELLRSYAVRGADQQARYFAMIALAEIGGEDNRAFLMNVLAKGSKSLERPWAAIALGVQAHRRFESNAVAEVDRGVGRLLLAQLDEVRNPDTRAAISIALGLVRFQEAADPLRELLDRYQNLDSLAGYICVGLALMGDQHAQQPIREIVASSVRRPERLQQAAIALGKLGDKRAATLLTDLMSDSQGNLARMAAIASALGYIGDRSSIPPLVEMLADEGLSDLPRAFAAAALGGIGDKELLPWNSKVATNMNYRAAVETLTNQSSGILDIL